MSDIQTAATASGSVTCTISTGPQIDLSEVLAAAQAVNSALTTASPLIIIAYGGAGGQGKAYEQIGVGGASGPGGLAQMTTSVDSFAETYRGMMLYFLFGSQGSSDHWGGKGGSSTVVSVVNLFMEGGSAANIVLCAGGGGGGGAASYVGHGYKGGMGGTAISSLGKSASGAGVAGSYSSNTAFYLPATGGAGGNNGVGGAGGSANGKSYNIAGGDGADGFGGTGGPVHIGDGPSTSTFWTNYPSTTSGLPTLPNIPAGLTGGGGGEGEGRGGTYEDTSPDPNMIAEGGGGGGGYGGGGGGGGGVDQDSQMAEDTEGGGGGGGGSWAAASTIESVAPPYTVPSFNDGDGYVMFIFPA